MAQIVGNGCWVLSHLGQEPEPFLHLFLLLIQALSLIKCQTFTLTYAPRKSLLGRSKKKRSEVHPDNHNEDIRHNAAAVVVVVVNYLGGCIQQKSF